MPWPRGAGPVRDAVRRGRRDLADKRGLRRTTGMSVAALRPEPGPPHLPGDHHPPLADLAPDVTCLARPGAAPRRPTRLPSLPGAANRGSPVLVSPGRDGPSRVRRAHNREVPASAPESQPRRRARQPIPRHVCLAQPRTGISPVISIVTAPARHNGRVPDDSSAGVPTPHGTR